MSAKQPGGFYANTLRLAYPESHTYKVALYEGEVDLDTYTTSGECATEGYEAGGMTLTGYQVVQHKKTATLRFNRHLDWFNVTVKARSAVVYDADTGVVLSIMSFGRQVGVMGGVFSLTLAEEGVVELGAHQEQQEEGNVL